MFPNWRNSFGLKAAERRSEEAVLKPGPSNEEVAAFQRDPCVFRLGGIGSQAERPRRAFPLSNDHTERFAIRAVGGPRKV